MPDAFAELDSLSTEELRHKAFRVAERRLDVAFLWDVVRHLRPTHDAVSEDGSAGGIGGTIADAVSAIRELTGNEGFGDAEPLLRAKFLDYLQAQR